MAVGLESSVMNDVTANALQVVEPVDVTRRMAAGDTFVVNIVTSWCPDCSVRQKQHIDGFAQNMKSHDVDVLQVNVQQLKGDFLSAEHEQLTDQFGGRGYPRTVLIRHGVAVDQDNVEVVAEDTLSELANKFVQIIAES